MTTRSRARTFHATAKALHSAASRQLDEREYEIAEPDAGAASAAPEIVRVEVSSIDPDRMRKLHAEYRWAEGKLMQASERLAEAQEARRKDLVALACMRRELRGSFVAERAYLDGQLRRASELLPGLWEHETSLADIVAGGAPTMPVLRELATIRTERKLIELATAQIHAQLARIEDNECTLEYEVANEAFDKEQDGRTMAELARMRSSKTRAHRAAQKAATEARSVMQSLGLDAVGFGEISAIAAFLAAEFEGDARSHERVERIRKHQVEAELELLPRPVAAWKAGLRHPMTWVRTRRA